MNKLQDWFVSVFIVVFVLLAAFAFDDSYREEQMQAQILDELITQNN